VLRCSNISTELINCKIFYLSFGSNIKNKQRNNTKLPSFLYFYIFYRKSQRIKSQAIFYRLYNTRMLYTVSTQQHKCSDINVVADHF